MCGPFLIAHQRAFTECINVSQPNDCIFSVSMLTRIVCMYVCMRMYECDK